MTTETMTIHKALAELKTIDARIHSAIEASVPCVANKHSNVKIGGITVSDFINTVMKPSVDKVEDLITRRNAIKRAVVLSNARTMVCVNGVEYTVAEAIDMKNHGMELQHEFYNTLHTRYGYAMLEINKNSGEILSTRADKYIIDMYGTKDKVDADTVKKARDQFIESNTYELIDPCKIISMMDEMEKQYDAFMSEVDSQLSVSNALTTIEVSF